MFSCFVLSHNQFNRFNRWFCGRHRWFCGRMVLIFNIFFSFPCNRWICTYNGPTTTTTTPGNDIRVRSTTDGSGSNLQSSLLPHPNDLSTTTSISSRDDEFISTVAPYRSSSTISRPSSEKFESPSDLNEVKNYFINK